MALTKTQIEKLKFDYCTGKLSQRKIAEKHGISRNTLIKYAKEGKWKYGENAAELNQKIKEKIFDQFVEDEVSKAVKITNDYLEDIEKYRKLALIPANELAKAYNKAEKEGSKVSKKEFSRIYESAKPIKMAIEALNLGYNGARKALGMDREEEIKKRQTKPDPTEGMTLDDVREAIKKLEND